MRGSCGDKDGASSHRDPSRPVFVPLRRLYCRHRQAPARSAAAALSGNSSWLRSYHCIHVIRRSTPSVSK